MANLTHTLCDEGPVYIGCAEFSDETLTFPGADDYAAGTLLGRRAVATAVTPVAHLATGTGTLTAVAVITGNEVPMVGNWTLICTAAVANGGVFQLKDPNGVIKESGLAMTPGSGGATTLKSSGFTLTITDATDFAVGDYFTLPVVADGTVVVYSPAEKGGAQIPIGLLTYPVSKAGSGTVPVRMMISGTVNKNRLVIDDTSSITAAILDQLRAAGITTVDIKQLSKYDNQ